jgi:hypothetical protein
MWLGEARQETFFVPREKSPRFDGRQYWHSERDPEHLFFWLKIPNRQRRYEPGANRDFTVYHGPFRLRAIPSAELAPLWRKDEGPASGAPAIPECRTEKTACIGWGELTNPNIST